MSNQLIASPSDPTNLYLAINGDGHFIPKKKKEVVVGVLGALMMQVNLINIIGQITGIFANLMKDLAQQIETLNKQKVDELNAINDAMSKITKDGDNSPDMYALWNNPNGGDYHPDWAAHFAQECSNQSLSQLMNTYSTRSTSFDTQIKPLQSLTDALQSSISNHSQNQASFLQQMQALENLFTQLT